MSVIKSQKVELYLDYGTVPSLSYILHFLKNREDKETVRFFGLSRFEFPDDIIQSYPENTFFTYKITNQDPKAFFACFEQYLTQTDAKIALNLHLNGLHLWATLPRLLYFYSRFTDKISDIHLHIYDDGSEGLVNQYNITQDYADYFSGDHSYQLSQISNLVKGEAAHISKLFLERYLWQKVLPTTYYFLSDTFFKKAGLDRVISNYELIDLYQFNQLDKESQSILLRMLSISPQLVAYWQEVFDKHKVFLFTGTTIYDLDEESEDLFIRLHINAVEHYLYSNGNYYVGEGYVLAIKGHPNSKVLNERLKQQYPNALHIPASIPFEILVMLGFIPTKMGGFASTSYLDFPKENIVDVIFMTHQDKVKNKQYIFKKQAELIEVMKEMECLSEHQIRYYSQLRKL